MSTKTEQRNRKSDGPRKRSSAGTKQGNKCRKLAGADLPGSESWADWVHHLTARTIPLPFGDLVPNARTHPLKWALPDRYELLAAPKLLKQLTRLHKGRCFASPEIARTLRQWLEQIPERGPDSLFGLECLGWAHALPRLGAVLTQADWRELLEQLEDTIEAAGGITLHDDPAAHQLLNGELPLTLAYLFPKISKYKKLRKAAVAALSFGANELLDGEGLVNARHLGAFRELLACWTRCSLVARSSDWKCFDKDGRYQYEWAVRQSLRVTRNDGSLVLSRGLSGEWCADLMACAIAEAGDHADRKLADVVLPGRRGKLSDRQMRRLPEPSLYSEWSELCVMRSKWSRKSPQFACSFAGRELRTELWSSGRLLWSGTSDPVLRVNDRPLIMTGDWAELCWFTDEDVDYLELEGDFQHGWRVQRQMLLARRDNFLLMADVILGEEPGEIQYSTRLPLAGDIDYLPEEETCEGYLKNSRPLATVVPLGLPEWRQGNSKGTLEVEAQQLCLRMQAPAAQRLYVPLFVDLSARRWLEKRTWRQLTVAEHLEIQPADVAVSYRVQMGRKQWLLYRSLAERANRTFLGQNVSQEFVVARFDLDGGVEELIEIE